MLDTSSGARSGRAPAHPVDDRPDVVRRRAAAAADDRDPVALDELLQDARQRVGLLGEDRLAVRALEREPGVRDAVHRDRTELAEEADRVAHVLGPGRAVQPDGVDVERGERGEHRLDVGPEQHLAALREERHARLDRHAPAGQLERLAGAEDRGLDLEDVLRGLDDDQVHAALDEALRLLGEDLDELAEGDPAERGVVARRKVPGGADRARHEAVLAGGGAGDLRRPAVDLGRMPFEAPLLELQPAGLEGVRLEDLGPGVEHRLVHTADHVRAVEDERLVTLAGESAVVLGRQVELLERGAHAAIEDHDPASYGISVGALGQGAIVPTLTRLCEGWALLGRRSAARPAPLPEPMSTYWCYSTNGSTSVSPTGPARAQFLWLR
jgi:hypothetical protein